MKILNASELETVLRLSMNADFQKFLTILRESVTELANRSSMLRETTDLRWNQGRIQELLDILKGITDSNANLDYLVSQRKKD